MTAQAEIYPPIDDDEQRPLTAVEERALAVRKQLRGQIGQIHTLPGRDGAKYHTGEQVIEHTINTLNEENWSTKILDRWREVESDEVCVLLEMEAIMWVPDPNDPEIAIRQVVRHQEIGVQHIKRSRAIKDQDGNVISGNLPLSIGDDYKSATTDAIKRCARLLSVGLYLWQKTPTVPYRRSEAEEDERAALAARPTGRPVLPPQPVPAPDREVPAGERSPQPMPRWKVEERYLDALSRATANGFRADWATQDVKTFSDTELRQKGAELGAFNNRQPAGVS